MEEKRVCSCGCQKYTKSMDEVVEALEKHRNAAVHLKEVAEAQRKKVNNYRELTTKMQDDLDNLEIEIKEKDHLTAKVLKEKSNLENEVKFLIEKLDLKNEDIIRIEFDLKKQKEVSQKLFRSIMDEKEQLKEELVIANGQQKEDKVMIKTAKEEKENMLADIRLLMDDSKKLNLENSKKVELLMELKEEKEMLNEKLNNLERKNEKVKDYESNDDLIYDSKSLEEELSLSGNSINSPEGFECKECKEKFGCRDALNKHIKSNHMDAVHFKLSKLEKEIADQRLKIATSLIRLKQQELKTNLMPCVCKGFCSINHIIHSWKMSKSEELFSKYQSMYSYNQCDEQFSCNISMETRIESKHRKLGEERSEKSKLGKLNI